MFPLARVLSHQNSPHTCSKTHLVLTAYHHSIIFLNSAKVLISTAKLNTTGAGRSVLTGQDGIACFEDSNKTPPAQEYEPFLVL